MAICLRHQRRRADVGLDHDQAGVVEPVVAPSRALGDDHRAEQIGLAGDAVEDADDEEEVVADRDRRQLVDAA